MKSISLFYYTQLDWKVTNWRRYFKELVFPYSMMSRPSRELKAPVRKAIVSGRFGLLLLSSAVYRRAGSAF
jgi:hypothetical protein